MMAASPPLAATAPNRSLLDGPVLPWALAAFGVFSVYGLGDLAEALRGLRLPDTDDAMRLAEVRDLVAGQSWFDIVQHRFLPPGGVASHWSRLVDAPLAGGMAALTPLVGAPLAERLSVALWPPLLFLVYALVLARGMRVLFNGRAAILGIFAATQTVGMMMQFAPGRIDHHNVQIVLLLGVGLCLMRPERSLRTGAAAGALAACSMAVGLEALPLVAIAGLVFAADWWLAGEANRPPLVGFGLGLAASATLLFGLQTAPSLWTASACDALSPPWLWLSGTGGALALAAAATRFERPAARLGLSLCIGALGLTGFAWLFPACLHGPFTDMPDLVRLRWLEQVREMQPLATMLRESPAQGLCFSAVLFAAAITALVLAIRDARHRRPFAVACLFLTAGAIQSCLQLRGVYVASAFVAVIAGVCLDRVLPVSTAPALGTGSRVALLVAVLTLNAHVWLASGQLVEQALGMGQDQKASIGQAEACSAPAAFGPLAALPVGTVLAPIDLGPYLLVHTHHAIAAAPYHRAIAGLTAGLAAAEGSEDTLHRQAQATGAGYLVLCPGGKGEAFPARLLRGEATTDWLEPVPLDGSPLKAWRVR